MSAFGPLEGIAYIIATLRADSALTAYLPFGSNGIYHAVAPQANINNPPYILVNYQGGADVMGSFADRLFTDGLYQVAIYGPDTMLDSVLYPAGLLIDADLQRTSGTAQGGIINACFREQPVFLPENVEGTDIVWSRVGGLYRIQVI